MLTKIYKLLYAFVSLALLVSCSNDPVDDNTITQTIYRIPVVVHIIHNGKAIGEGANISTEQVNSQIEVLNEDFRRMANTNGFNENEVGADMQIEFFLAERDPNGNLLVEPGIDRVDGGRAEWPKGIFRNPIETILKPDTSVTTF